ncbi:MAG: hypothetical protein K0S23_577 [Fluviicola sp.]|nr:hypothetical protein [Fluviicola sp.]
MTVISLVCLVSSCVSWKKIDQVIKGEPVPHTFSTLRICNYAIPDSIEQPHPYNSFYTLNKMSLSRKDTLTNWKETLIQLDSLERGLMVTFFLRDTLADQYFLKGRWKNNFFYAKRRIKAKGIPPFFFFYNEKLSVLGNYGTHLSLFQSDLRAGMILLLSAGGQDYYREQYGIKTH